MGLILLSAVGVFSASVAQAGLWSLEECKIALEDDQKRTATALQLAAELFEGTPESVLSDFQRAMSTQGYIQLKLLPHLMEQLTIISEAIMKDGATSEVTLQTYGREGAETLYEAFGGFSAEVWETWERFQVSHPELYKSGVESEARKRRLADSLDINPLIEICHKLTAFLLRALPETRQGEAAMVPEVVQLRVRADDQVEDHFDGNYLTTSLNIFGRGTHSPETGVNQLSLLVFSGTYRASQQGVPALWHGGHAEPGTTCANLFMQFNLRRL